MAITVTQSFIDMWSDEVHHLFQQNGSKLRDCVRLVTGVTGNTHKFHKLGSVNAQQGRGTQFDDLTSLEPVHSIATATMNDFYAPLYLDRLDEVKTNADLRREFVMTAANAIGRAMDDLIILDGFDAASSNGAGSATLVDASSGFTLTEILEAKKNLDLADVPQEDRYFVVSPAALQELLDVTEVTSSDFQNVKALVQGQIDTAFGFKWKMSTRLNKNVGTSGANIRSNYAYHKSAVGVAVGYDISTEINYVPEKVAYLVNSMCSLAAVNVDDSGIVEVHTTDTDADTNTVT